LPLVAFDRNDFLVGAGRQRVDGFVYDAVLSAQLDVPRPVVDKLASRARRIVRDNVCLAGLQARKKSKRREYPACVTFSMVEGV
jgi:hypothetical protein